MDCNKCTTPGWGTDIERGCVCMGGRDMYGKLVLFVQFCYETKTALKSSLFNKSHQ